MTAPTTSWPQDQNSVSAKAARLFKYLKELTELRSEVKRNCEEYEQVVWWTEIPREKECFCVAWEMGREAAYEQWIRVERPRRKKAPVPQPTLAQWLHARDIADASLEAPPLRESITETVSGIDGNEETVLRKLEDFPSVTRQWEMYVENHWWPWALEDRRLQTVQSIYNELFAAYQTQERLGESFEIVVGIGLLVWRPPHGPEVRRHVVTGQVTIDFDMKTGLISISPAAEGFRLTLEQEMLEPPDRPLPEIQNGIQEQLLQIGEVAWESPELIATLNWYFNQLSPANSLDPSLQPADGSVEHTTPQMTLAPAVLVRRRTDRNLVRVFEEIANQIEAGGEVPIGVEKLVSIRDDKSAVNGSGPDAYAEETSELYFPLPSNQAQREIARKLESRYGILVQGPPGTGKSHTIANLICHLLASGQRLLVTSHTARALRVLKNYFPKEISPLCVSLLGDDSTAMRELEDSVQGILNQYNAWEPAASRSRTEKLEQELHRSRADLASAYAELKILREGETQHVELTSPIYRGTPLSIAKRVAKEASSYGWMALNRQHNIPPPLTNQEASELLRLIRELHKKGDAALRAVLPEASWLIAPQRFDELLAQERDLATKLGPEDPAIASSVAVLLTSSVEARSRLSRSISEIVSRSEALMQRGEDWIGTATTDVIASKHQFWAELQNITASALAALAPYVARVSQFKVSGLEGRDLAVMRADAERLRDHLLAGKGLGLLVRHSPLTPKNIKSALYVVDEIRVNGNLCDTPAVLIDLLTYLDAVMAVEHIERHWSVYLRLDDRPLSLAVAEYRRRSELLAQIMELRQLLDAAIKEWKEVTGSVPPGWTSMPGLRSALAALTNAGWRWQLESIRTELQNTVSNIEKLKHHPDCHPLVTEMATAIQFREIDQYRRIYEQVLQAWELHSRLQRKLQLQHKLASDELIALVEQSNADPVWDTRLSKFEEAWHWAGASIWLQSASSVVSEAAALQTIEISTQRIASSLKSLASQKAWSFVLDRLKHHQTEHLSAWRLAVKKIGKGTGKYASQYRREARLHLEQCRDAIPAWIMPIFRVAETTKPLPNMFDVAIIDEASQSGPEALFLQYIAKKIVVVGDDQQISPDSVGLDRESVNSLRERYIHDVPMQDALGVDNSFFDQALIRFSGRVRLREHFRCMPEIIQFSNNLCYQSEPLIPLRQYGSNRLAPVLTRYVPEGYVKGFGDRIVNRPEAEAIVDQIEKCLGNTAYDGKTFGVICLQGHAQWNLIRDLLMERIGAQKMQQRGLSGGNPYAFQGDERDVMFLSMVAARSDDRHIGVMSKESDKRRFNVAASRARDQMWLFHSVSVDELSSACFRRKLLEYCLNPTVAQEEINGIDLRHLQTLARDRFGDSKPPLPFDSWFEVDVFLRIVDRGFRVIPQYPLAGKHIDLVVEGIQGRLAVECDGDQWHGSEQWEQDIDRQRMLERCGLQFVRIRGSAFYRDPDDALTPLWKSLESRGIFPSASSSPRTQPTAAPPPTTSTLELDALADNEDENGDSFDVRLDESTSENARNESEDELVISPVSQNGIDTVLAEYVEWLAHPMPDPHSASLQELMEGLIEIVAAEGPMICRRAYALYNRAAGNARLGHQITKVMNRAIYRAVRLGRLQQNDEQRKGGQINQIVRLVGSPEVVLRKRGSRTLEEIPPEEIRSLRERIAVGEDSQDDNMIVRRMATVYGIGRVTLQSRKLLLS